MISVSSKTIFPDAEEVFPDAEEVFLDAEGVFPDAEGVFPDAEGVFLAGKMIFRRFPNEKMPFILRRQFLQMISAAGGVGSLAACRADLANSGFETANDGQPIVTIQGRTLPADAAPLSKQILYEAAAEPRHLDISRDIYGAGVAINWGGEPLLRRDQNQNLVPALAESFTASPNKDYFDFKIRANARWSDGVPITAHDWVFTFRHLASPTLDNPWAWFFYDIAGVRALKAGTGKPEDVGAEAIDEMTLRLHGEGGAVPHLPALLAYQAAAPAPRHKAESNPEHWADSAEGFVSSGPMRLLRWQHHQILEWDANPFYNGTHKVGIQKLIQIVGAPAMGWFNAWLNKEIDYIPILQPQELAQVIRDSELQQYLHTFNNFQTEYLALDCLRPPLDNLKLRQALSHAIDREPYCNNVMMKTRSAAFSMLPPDFPAYNPELKSIQRFDVELARALLAEAGYPDGKDSNGAVLTIDLYSNGRDVALEYVKDQWERYLNIAVNLQLLEGGVWGQRRARHLMPVYRGQYEYDYLDPRNLLTQLWRSSGEKGSPRHSWHNPTFDELVETAGREIEESPRMNLYKEAERVLVEDVAGIFLSHTVTHQVWYPYLNGIEPNTRGDTIFRYLDISRFQMYFRNDIDRWRKSR